jgi:hypothetical protein
VEEWIVESQSGDRMNKKTRRVKKKHKKAVERQKAKRRKVASKQ